MIILTYALIAFSPGIRPLYSHESPALQVAYTSSKVTVPASESVKVKITSDESGTLRFYNVNGRAVSFANRAGDVVTSQRIKANTPELCTLRKGPTYRICVLVHGGFFSEKKAEYELKAVQPRAEAEAVHLSPMITFRWTGLLPVVLFAGIAAGLLMVQSSRKADALLKQELQAIEDMGKAAKEADEKVKKIGEYILVDEIGKGTLATVYRVKNDKGELFAMKVPSPQISTDPRFKTRFLREAPTLKTLNHPGVAKMYGYRLGGRGKTYICFEYVEGQSLRALLQENPVQPLRVVIKMISDIAAALAYAHSKRIIHRDVRPENIILTESNEVKITDFGIARALDSKALTSSGSTVIANPSYLPPEQIQTSHVDSRADLYSLGVMFYELLTARLPFQGENPLMTIQKLVSEEPCPPRTHNALIPEEIESVVMKLLRKDPGERYATADEVSRELRQFLLR